MELQSGELEQVTALCGRWVSEGVKDGQATDGKTLELEATFTSPEELWNDAWETKRGSASATRHPPTAPGIPYNNYVGVQRRLQQVGLLHAPLKDTLNIITFPNYRWTITGMADIRRYCETEDLRGLAYTVMQKQVVDDAPSYVSVEYGWRLKARWEVPVDVNTDATAKGQLENWAGIEKSYRLIRRFSFYHPTALPYMSFDVSAVVEDVRNAGGKRSDPWTKSEGKHNKGTRGAAALLQARTRKYEVEVELTRDATPEAEAKPKPLPSKEDLAKLLTKGVTLVIQGIQGNFTLMRTSEAKRVRLWYADMLNFRSTRYKPRPGFVGPNPVTLSRMNMTTTTQPLYPNIVTESYNVTDKADGMRCLLLVDAEGVVTLMDANMHVYASGHKTAVVKGGIQNSVLDCEFVTRNKTGGLVWDALIFDIYWMGGRDVRGLAFKLDKGEDRYTLMREWWTQYERRGDSPSERAKLPAAGKNAIIVRVKDFYFPKPTAEGGILPVAADLLRRDDEFPYHTDGLIFTPNTLAVAAAKPGEAPPRDTGRRWPQQFKWKPPQENTIDFLLRARTDAKGEVLRPQRQPNGALRFYKVFDLYVTGKQYDAVADPYTTFMQLPPAAQLQGAKPDDGAQTDDGFVEVLFQPIEPEDAMAAVAYLYTDRDDKADASGDDDTAAPDASVVWTVGTNQEQIMNNSIVEMSYDPTADAGWRWRPIRVRHDKTERYAAAKAQRRRPEGTIMNAVDVAMSIWKTLHEPVTEEDIATGKGLDEAAVQAYFASDTTEEMRGITAGLRKFHNQFIKDELLYGAVLPFASGMTHKEGRAHVLDIGCGTGQDIHKLNKHGVGFALLTDPVEDNIKNPYRGAARLALHTLRERDAWRAGAPAAKTDVVFAVADGANVLDSGAAGLSPLDSDILRWLFKPKEREAFREVPESLGAYPRVQALEGAAAGGFDVISVMFSLHYFFESADTLNGLLRNIHRCLRVGGNVLMANFDGSVVYRLLYGLEKGQTYSRRDGRTGTEMWHITKLYDNIDGVKADDDLPGDERAYGLKIAVSFYRIEDRFVEFLVSRALLERRMAEVGCQLRTLPAGATVKHRDLLAEGTGMFETAYEAAGRASPLFQMSAEMYDYSRLNRWYIFRRKEKKSTPEVDDAQPHVLRLISNTVVAVDHDVKPVINDAVTEVVAEAEVSPPVTIVEPKRMRGKGKPKVHAVILPDAPPAPYVPPEPTPITMTMVPAVEAKAPKKRAIKLKAADPEGAQAEEVTPAPKPKRVIKLKKPAAE